MEVRHCGSTIVAIAMVIQLIVVAIKTHGVKVSRGVLVVKVNGPKL